MKHPRRGRGAAACRLMCPMEQGPVAAKPPLLRGCPASGQARMLCPAPGGPSIQVGTCSPAPLGSTLPTLPGLSCPSPGGLPGDLGESQPQQNSARWVPKGGWCPADHPHPPEASWWARTPGVKGTRAWGSSTSTAILHRGLSVLKGLKQALAPGLRPDCSCASGPPPWPSFPSTGFGLCCLIPEPSLGLLPASCPGFSGPGSPCAGLASRCPLSLHGFLAHPLLRCLLAPVLEAFLEAQLRMSPAASRWGLVSQGHQGGHLLMSPRGAHWTPRVGLRQGGPASSPCPLWAQSGKASTKGTWSPGHKLQGCCRQGPPPARGALGWGLV